MAVLGQPSSNDPFAAPVIDPNYFSHPDDVALMLKGAKLMRKLAQTKAFQAVITQEVHPGAQCQTDEQLIHSIKDYAWTVFHPSCTCRMGKDTTTSVVDARLGVHGIENLRVCDTSIMPFLVSGNTNAPTIMIAEKGAAMILEDHRQS
ncbi:MAG: GMC oxidoreductase [Oceanospirillaceae bacterium]